MKSISTRNSIAIDESMPSSKSSKRKQGSTTLRSLKESFKFRGSMSPKKSDSQTGSAAHNTSTRIRRSSIDRQESRKTKQRFSAQRISLFRYEYVRVRSSSVVRRSSSSTVGSDTTRSSDNASYSSSKSRSSVRVKPTTLMANGILEVYQIYTPKSNAEEKVQEMNYLSLGRKDNIVHPILPRLQVTRKLGLTQRFIIHFYNPDRFWEVEFLASSAAASGEVSNAVKEFESVISKICDYNVVNEPLEKQRTAPVTGNNTTRDSISRSESVVIEDDKIARTDDAKHEDDSDSDSDGDDLAYLLEDEEEEEKPEEQSINTNRSNTAALEESEGDLEAINEAFKKAMQNFNPSASYHSRRGSASERLIEYQSMRRFSSYQPRNLEEQSQSLSKRLSYIGSKRSSSVPTWFNYESPANITRRGN